VAMNNDNEIFFTGSLADSYFNNNPFRLFKVKVNSDNPVEIYSSCDSIRYLYITKNNTILGFKGDEINIDEFNYPNHNKYFSTRSIIRSDNDGKNWNEIDIKISGVTKIIEKDSGKIFLYASNFWNEQSDSNIYYSENDGKSWIKLSWNFGLVKGMSVLNDGNILVTNDSSIYISKDNGKSWNIHSKIILPIDLSTLFENSKSQLIAKNLTSGYRDSSYMYSSIDKGITWKQIFLSDTSKQGFAFRGIIIDSTIYAIDKNFQFFKSIDLGKSWTYLNDFTQELKDTSIITYYSALNINNKTYFFTKSNNIFKYDEIKNKLSLIYKPKLNINYFTFRDENIQIFSGDISYLANFENLDVLNNKITNSIPTFRDLLMYKSILSPTNRLILICNFDYGMGTKAYYSNNNLLTFHEYQDSVMSGTLFWGNNKELYSAFNNKLYISYDDGFNFAIFLDSLPLDLDPLIGGVSQSGNIYLLNYFELAFTTNKGLTWTTNRIEWYSRPNKILFKLSDRIFVSGDLNSHSSSDNGETWVRMFGCSDYGMCDLDLHPKGDLFFISASTIYKSLDNGITRSEVKRLDGNIYGHIHIANSGLIFAPPYFSSDNGLTWINKQVEGIVNSNKNGMILLTTRYSASDRLNPVFYKFNSPNGIEAEYPTNFENLISPNPASNFIEISYPPLERGSGGVAIKIYNVYGQTVLSVGVQILEPLRINVSGLAPGMYFVRIGDKVSKFIKI
jgi:photosystem II stability/assembly factor-like uncharacterized protein